MCGHLYQNLIVPNSTFGAPAKGNLVIFCNARLFLFMQGFTGIIGEPGLPGEPVSEILAMYTLGVHYCTRASREDKESLVQPVLMELQDCL